MTESQLKAIETKEEILKTLLHDLDRLFDVSSNVDDDDDETIVENESISQELLKKFATYKEQAFELLVKAEQLNDELDDDMKMFEICHKSVFEALELVRKELTHFDNSTLQTNFQVI